MVRLHQVAVPAGIRTAQQRGTQLCCGQTSTAASAQLTSADHSHSMGRSCRVLVSSPPCGTSENIKGRGSKSTLRGYQIFERRSGKEGLRHSHVPVCNCKQVQGWLTDAELA